MVSRFVRIYSRLVVGIDLLSSEEIATFRERLGL